MKIGVDAGCLGILDERLQVGVYHVAKNVLEQLAILDTTNQYLLYSFHPIDPVLMKRFGKRMKNIVVRPTIGWTKFALPIQLSRDRIDVFLGLNQSLPQYYSWQKKYKTAVVFYDLAFETHPRNYSESFKKMHRHSLYAAQMADKIIAISQSTKNDIMHTFHIPDDAIRVSYLGIRTFPLSRNELNITTNPYFLFVGAYKPGKNIPTLLKAFEAFLTLSEKSYDLVLVGGNKWLDPEIELCLQTLSEKTKQHIKQVGFLPDEQLAMLYAHAQAFVSPSLYEGFGLGFVEAMSYGCPVIGSDIPVLREVIGSAGVLVDPQDVNLLARTMRDIMANDNLRKKMCEASRMRAKQFSWKKFGKDVMEVLVA